MRKYGCVSDCDDDRDKSWKAGSTPCRITRVHLPVDLRDPTAPDMPLGVTQPGRAPLRSWVPSVGCPPIRNQGGLSTCTAFSVTSLVQYVRKKQLLEDFVPSVLFTYCNAWQLETRRIGNLGTTIRNTIKATIKYGIVREEEWPYDETKDLKLPPKELYDKAVKLEGLSYHRIASGVLYDMQQCLTEGYPFVFGLKLFHYSYENPQTKSTGIIPIPLPHEQEIDNHCMMAVGWKFIQNKRYFIVQNSLGEACGDKGFYYVPFDYLGNNHLAGDIWTMRPDK